MVVVAGVTVTGTSLVTGPMPGLISPEPAMKCGMSWADCPLAIACGADSETNALQSTPPSPLTVIPGMQAAAATSRIGAAVCLRCIFDNLLDCDCKRARRHPPDLGPHDFGQLRQVSLASAGQQGRAPRMFQGEVHRRCLLPARGLTAKFNAARRRGSVPAFPRCEGRCEKGAGKEFAFGPSEGAALAPIRCGQGWGNTPRPAAMERIVKLIIYSLQAPRPRAPSRLLPP